VELVEHRDDLSIFSSAAYKYGCPRRIRRITKTKTEVGSTSLEWNWWCEERWTANQLSNCLLSPSYNRLNTNWYRPTLWHYANSVSEQYYVMIVENIIIIIIIIIIMMCGVNIIIVVTLQVCFKDTVFHQMFNYIMWFLVKVVPVYWFYALIFFFIVLYYY